MNDTKTAPRKRPKGVKMRAMQKLFHDNRIVEEREVFWFRGDKMPSEEIAVPAETNAAIGRAPDEPDNIGKEPPSWTTKGWVDRYNRGSGRDDGDDE